MNKEIIQFEESKSKDGAFPVTYNLSLPDEGDYIMVRPGMSKRFYAACAAMQGLMANPNPDCIRMTNDEVARYAYSLADFLLKQEEVQHASK